MIRYSGEPSVTAELMMLWQAECTAKGCGWRSRQYSQPLTGQITVSEGAVDEARRHETDA